jgi:hypothetical protein
MWGLSSPIQKCGQKSPEYINVGSITRFIIVNSIPRNKNVDTIPRTQECG